MISNITPVESNANNGFFHVFNLGAFVAYFSVFYRYNGRDYYKESPVFSIFRSEIITVPRGAFGIDFQVYVGVYFQAWNSIYFRTFKTPPSKCYRLDGITFYSTCTEFPCNYSSIGSGTQNSNPSIQLPNRTCCNCCKPCSYYNC